jgi:ribonuclease E
MGVIVRTASLGVTKEDFQRDLDYLLDTYKEVLARYKHRHGPGLVWQEDDVVTRTLRDCFSSDMEEVHIDDLDTFHQAQGFFKRTMPQHLAVLKHYIGKKPLFSRFQTEEQIDRVYARKVSLPSGGALVLDQTEALVAIDVNSGKTSGEGVEDMAFKTNMEAAEEVARQLRLRDLAGLIVIDFIDMKREGNNRAVQDRLVDCLKEDKARMEVGKINRFGVLVMTRQRIRPSLQHVTHEACPMCQGSGKVKNLEALVLSVVRRIKAILCREPIKEIRIKLAPAIAMAVLNQKRKDLADLEAQHDGQIVILADPETGYGEMAAEIERREEEPAEKPSLRHPDRIREPEDETVVLGGDAPISFEKALGESAKPALATAETEIKYDRRDAQRAALGERERLRALFESVKPEDELRAGDLETEEETKPTSPKSSRRRRGRKDSVETAPLAVPSAPAPPEQEPEPEPPILTADLLADLAMPAPRPRLLGSGSAPVPAPMAPQAKRGRPRIKVEAVTKTGPKAETKAVAPKGRKKAEAADSAPVPPAAKARAAAPRAAAPRAAKARPAEARSAEARSAEARKPKARTAKPKP